jgi:hypothetical protein
MNRRRDSVRSDSRPLSHVLGQRDSTIFEEDPNELETVIRIKKLVESIKNQPKFVKKVTFGSES